MKMCILCLCKCILMFLTLIFLFVICCYGAQSNTITQGQILRDGETLVSTDGSFTFGFFTPPNSSLRYVGIWFSKFSVSPYVWVANRNAPLANKNGSFTIGYEGNLLVYNGTGNIVWSSDTCTAEFSNNYTAILHNDGNFEIKGNYSSLGSDYTCWQSFDHPTDTYLPGMRVLVSERVGENRLFTSWKSRNDPSNGSYSMGVDPRAAPQVVIWDGSNRHWRSGHFNGMKFTGVPSMSSFYYYGFKISNADSQGNMYLSYEPLSKYRNFKFVISWDGYEKSLVSPSGGNNWTMLQSEPSTVCDIYNKCGANAYCSPTRDSICNCFRGFKPKVQDQWDNGNWSDGCIRKTHLDCQRNSSQISQDGFLKADNAKLPDFADLLNRADEQECKQHCLNNCSCKAYAFAGGIGCMIWGGELTDIQLFEQDGGTLHIRVASSDLGEISKLSGLKIAAIVIGGLIFVSIMFALLIFGAKLKVSQGKRKTNDILTTGLGKGEGYSADISRSVRISGEGNLVNAPLIDYDLIASATNFFSEDHKLGEGGFGPVYRGFLPGGQEIAVKKLSRKSGQGMEEFKNEIILIAKIQHKNLVRILGCCVRGEDKMLIYEYMPNKSLDFFLFDSAKQSQLGWSQRLTIIKGVARGLLYLHRDARYKIIHRDLKASNILLDQDMNPKISDFGMARIFEGDEDQLSTERLVGTIGYMSPEYAMEGYFSEKSDVYSFGVLLLEVITGRKCFSFHSSEHTSLVGYAWEQWSQESTIELVDPSIRTSCPVNEVSRCVQIAVLCVQNIAAYRPMMAQVVLWLESDSVLLWTPKQPAMTSSPYRECLQTDCSKEISSLQSSNDITSTVMTPT